MLEIVIDTETTGLDPLDGHRIVEIGAIEPINRCPTGQTFHRHLCPERSMPADALAVHGLSAGTLPTIHARRARRLARRALGTGGG